MEPLDQRIPGPALMGIVNVTPDSFSDGGLHLDPDVAIAHGRALHAAGAAIVDVGGQSTRPGSDPIDAATEAARVVPVVRALAAEGIAVSVDTSKAAVAAEAIAAGATMVNDVTALRDDPGLAAVVRDSGVDLCLMHMRGTPRTMQDDPRYDDVVAEVGAFLRERVEAVVEAGVDADRICVDPGIGFGKTTAHNLALLAATGDVARAAGRPLMLGVSRKRFLGELLGDADGDRTGASVAAGLAGVERGAWMLRVHDVAPHAEALRIQRAIAAGGVA